MLEKTFNFVNLLNDIDKNIKSASKQLLHMNKFDF